MPPRLLRPKDEPDSSESPDVTLDQKSNKRRAVSSACIPCRKRKSKCDGGTPSCSTCTAVYRTECTYDADSDHRRKGALRRDIQTLQQRNDALDVIVASLRSLPESEAVALLHSIRADSNYDMIAASLRSDVHLPHSYAPQTLEADFAHGLSPSISNRTNDRTPFASALSQPGPRVNTAVTSSSAPSDETQVGWYSTPQDPEFVEHLLNLYFCWVHPFHHLFSREYFLHDMTRGRTGFCSALLVNAVLAFACSYSDRPMARTDPHDPGTAGDQYFAEAMQLLNADGPSSITTVQALGIMAIREASHGRDSKGYQLAGRCVRMALELGLHLSVAGSGLRAADIEVRKITFWAVFNLETSTSATGYGRLSQLPRSAADIEKPSMTEQSETQPWRPCEDTTLLTSPSIEQPSRSMLFVNHLSQLSELASDMANTFYAPRERFTSRRLAMAYEQYKDWYRHLPDAFRLENTTLPHVLVLHMYYHACVLHLFRPFIKLDLRDANLFPRETCTQSANEISSLMGALRAMYGLRRVTMSVTSFLLSASTIHLLNLPSEPSSSNLCRGLLDLQAITTNHKFAGRCIEVIHALADKWGITLPESARNVFGTVGHSWPSPHSSQFFATSIPRKSSAGSGASSSASVSSNSQHVSPFRPPTHPPQKLQQHQQQSSAIHSPTFTSDPFTSVDQTQPNPVFWTPFPMQGMPIMTNTEASSGSLGFAGVLATHSQWSFLEAMPSHGSTSSFASRHNSDPGHLSDPSHMQVDGGFQDWQWQ